MVEYALGGQPKEMPYVLTIRERLHSWAGRPPARTVHPTRSEAEAELLDYVKRNWAAEVGTEVPEDPGEMIREYFADVLEAYEIKEGNPEIPELIRYDDHHRV